MDNTDKELDNNISSPEKLCCTGRYLSKWLMFSILLLVIYPFIIYYNFKTNSDIHGMLELWASMIAFIATGMLLIHFFALGTHYFLWLFLGFVFQGTEDLLHAIFSFTRLFGDHFHAEHFIPATYASGRFLLILCCLLALYYRNKKTTENKRRKTFNRIFFTGFLLSGIITILLIKYHPTFLLLPGKIISRPVDLFLAILYLGGIFAYIFTSYKHKSFRNYFSCNIISSLIFGFFAEIYMIYTFQFKNWQAELQ